MVGNFSTITIPTKSLHPKHKIIFKYLQNALDNEGIFIYTGIRNTQRREQNEKIFRK
jgi:hypothetical protein